MQNFRLQNLTEVLTDQTQVLSVVSPYLPVREDEVKKDQSFQQRCSPCGQYCGSILLGEIARRPYFKISYWNWSLMIVVGYEGETCPELVLIALPFLVSHTYSHNMGISRWRKRSCSNPVTIISTFCSHTPLYTVDQQNRRGHRKGLPKNHVALNGDQ